MAGILERIAGAVEARPRTAYAACAALVAVSAAASVGWLQADEHARVLEPAHLLVYGYATLPWELDPAHPLVSFLLGALHAPCLLVTRALGLSGLTEAAVLRGFSGLVCMTRLWAFALIGGGLGLRRDRRALYTVLYLAAPFTLLLLPRTSQENWATTAVMWGFYFVLRATAAPTQKRWGFAAGAFLSLAFSFRFQMGPSALGLWILAAVQVGRRGGGGFGVAALVAGALVGLVPLGAVDGATVGTPFLPAYNYLMYALTDEGGADLWGRQPWHTYLTGFLGNFYPPLSVVLLPLVALGLVLRPTLAVIVVPFMAVHLAISHKEIRYLTPMIPFWVLAVLAGFEGCERRWAARAARLPWRGLARYAAVGGAFGVLAAMVPINPQPFFYDEIRRSAGTDELRRPYTFVANSRSSVSQFYVKNPADTPAETITIAAFYERLGAAVKPHGDFAVQRLPIDELPRLEGRCRIVYSSIPAWQRRALEALRGLLKFRYLDAIFRCD